MTYRFSVGLTSVWMAGMYPLKQRSDLVTETEPPTETQARLGLMHARAEVARLREREQLFSTLMGAVNAVLWAFDGQSRRMVYVSPAYERIFGRSAALLLADFDEWRNSVYPDDLEYAEQSLYDVLELGAIEGREYRIIRGDGQLRWISDKCFVAQGVDHERGSIVVGIAEDITEKKQLEGELQRLATTDVLTQSSNRRHFFDAPIASSSWPGSTPPRWRSSCWILMTSSESTTTTATLWAIRCFSALRSVAPRYCGGVICSGVSVAKNSRCCCLAASRTSPSR